MSTSLVPVNDMDTPTLGRMLAKSGYFQDAREEAQAIVKVLAGRELGFGPVASMTGIYIVQGRVTLSANIMAAAVKRSGRYNYRVRKMTPDACEIEFFERTDGKWESIGVSAFTLADAKTAGTKNLDKFARNMLFARAMSNGVRWYCPDIMGGPIYTPEELGVPADPETGEIINGTATVIETQPEPPAQTTPTNGNGHEPEPPTTTQSTLLDSPHWINTEASRKKFWAWCKERNLSDADVHTILGVQHMADYPGSAKEACEAIVAYQKRTQAAA